MHWLPPKKKNLKKAKTKRKVIIRAGTSSAESESEHQVRVALRRRRARPGRGGARARRVLVTWLQAVQSWRSQLATRPAPPEPCSPAVGLLAKLVYYGNQNTEWFAAPFAPATPKPPHTFTLSLLDEPPSISCGSCLHMCGQWAQERWAFLALFCRPERESGLWASFH